MLSGTMPTPPGITLIREGPQSALVSRPAQFDKEFDYYMVPVYDEKEQATLLRLLSTPRLRFSTLRGLRMLNTLVRTQGYCPVL